MPIGTTNRLIPGCGAHHIALQARDWEASLRLYRDVLGMQIVAEFGTPERRILLLDLGDGSHLELFAPQPTTADQPASANVFTHIALATTNTRQATELVKKRAPELEIDGELQADTAVLGDFRAENYPFSTLVNQPNVLIFPNLDAANIAYKLMWRMGNAEAFGPILLGMAHPVHVLQRGSEAAEIANLTAVAVVDAQEHGGLRFRAGR